jgi:hypothetical protein
MTHPVGYLKKQAPLPVGILRVVLGVSDPIMPQWHTAVFSDGLVLLVRVVVGCWLRCA